jgi:hypothetical protein
VIANPELRKKLRRSESVIGFSRAIGRRSYTGGSQGGRETQNMGCISIAVSVESTRNTRREKS